MSKKGWIIIIVQTLVFLLVLGTMTRCNRNTVDILEHNISAYKDSIEYVVSKNGDLIAMKESLILTEEELRNELYMTNKELREIKKLVDDNIAYISKLEADLELKDTIWMKPDTVYIKDGTFVKRFNWVDTWTVIDATVSGDDIYDSMMTVDKLSVDVPLEIGLTDDYRFWARSSNPYVSFTDIRSVVVDGSSVKDKDSFISHGIHVGFGIHYGMFGQNWDFGPQAGYSLQWNF